MESGSSPARLRTAHRARSRTRKTRNVPRADGAGIFDKGEHMPTQKNKDLVEELKEMLASCTITVATDFTGLDVNAINELRHSMREKEIEYRVVKNTLTYLAADATENPELKEIVQGPTALAFGYSDPAQVAKALEEYIRVNRSTLTIRGAVMGRRSLSSSEVTTLSNLPSKEQLVAQFLGQLQAPLAHLAGQLQAPISRLLNVLNGPLVSLDILLQQRVQQLSSQENSN